MRAAHWMASFALAAASAVVGAQTTPVGLWKTIDDETKEARSFVRITEAGGTLTGRVEKLTDPAKQDARCDKCEGADKDKPIIGLTIVRNVRQSVGDGAVWEGGEILDPSNGKTYKVRLKPTDGGAKLEVRGYIGTPLLGRTQTWIRAE